MNTLFLIQDTFRKTSTIDDEIDACSNLSLVWKPLSYIPFSNTIELDIDYYQYPICVVRSGTKIIRLIEDPTSNITPHLRKFLKNGIWHSHYFDQINLIHTPIHNYLLNANAHFLPFKDAQNIKYKDPIFIKPSGDMKEFAGTILPPNTSINEYLNQTTYDIHINECTMLIQPRLETILAEARFIVVNKNIISGSYYKINNKLQSKRIMTNSPLFTHLQQMIVDFEPAPIYTIDIAILKGLEIKIIEYNCFNCSGLYQIDTTAVFKAINNFLST